MLAKFYNLSMIFERPADLPAVWAVHVLDFDVVTQGDDLQDALRMALEAASSVVRWDTEHQRDPLERRADDAEWARFRDLQLHGHPVADWKEIDETRLQLLATQGIAVFAWQELDASSHATTSRRKPAPSVSEAKFKVPPVSWPQPMTML